MSEIKADGEGRAGPEGDRYKLQVFRVDDWHEDGTPKTLSWIRDNDKITVTEGMAFITAFVPSVMIGNGGKG